jgi:hypothetical protein
VECYSNGLRLDKASIPVDAAIFTASAVIARLNRKNVLAKKAALKNAPTRWIPYS